MEFKNHIVAKEEAFTDHPDMAEKLRRLASFEKSEAEKCEAKVGKTISSACNILQIVIDRIIKNES